MIRSTVKSRKRNIKRVVVASSLLITLIPTFTFGAEGLLSIRQLSTAGRHLEAVREASSRSDLTLSDRLAAAKSAWALGLIDKARLFWDDSLADPRFRGADRSRELLGRAILELQEGNYTEANTHAERATRLLPPSELRAQLWILIGESLTAQGAIRQGMEYFERAAKEAGGRTRSDALFQLGESEFRSGLLDKARYRYVEVDESSPQGEDALKRLAEIDFMQRNFSGVLTWIKEGRDRFPERFGESWVYYAAISASLALGQEESAAEELDRFGVKYTERDPWYALAAAAYEAHAVKTRFDQQPTTQQRARR